MNDRIKGLANILRRRHTTLKKVCAQANVDCNHFSAVVNGKRAGKHTWKRLRDFLMDDERQEVVTHYGEVFEVGGFEPIPEPPPDPDRQEALPFTTN